MRRFRSAFAIIASLSLVAACTQPAEEAPTPPVEPTAPLPTTPVAPPVSYACESGQSITVAYPDSATAQLAYKGRSYALRLMQSGTGARYIGSGVAWWTALQDGQETAVLSRLGPNDEVGTTVLERCSRPSSGPTAPGPLPGPQPVPGGVLPAAAPCKGPQLKLSNEGGDAAMGNRVVNIGVQNVGARACSLTGYPGVTLQDARGRTMTAIRAEQSTGSYFTQGQTPAPVTLQPLGKAAFEMAWNVVPHEGEGETVCPTAAKVRVTAPGDTSPVSLNLGFTPCGGYVRVSPIRSLATPAPNAAAGTSTSL